MLITDRVSERRRAAQLARHYRDQEGLTIAEIARRLGRAESTVKAYLYDPIGAKAREVKARYRGRLPGLRRTDQRAQRQGRRVRLLQLLPPRRDRAAMDPQTEP
jgi:predicted transcriptional regulator